MQDVSHAKPTPTPRTMSRDSRRQQLIESTIETLALRGYARTTLADVARMAGLSQGLVNFHFATKENLLAETLAYLAEEYRHNWSEALAVAGDDPARQLDAMIFADFNPAICSPQRLSAWCSFWGETQCRPMYRDLCGSNDEVYTRTMVQICGRLIDQGAYDANSVLLARIIGATIEGVWLDLMTMSSPYGLNEALTTVRTCAAMAFPRHFGPDGVLQGLPD